MLPDPALLWPFLLGLVLGLAARAEQRRLTPPTPRPWPPVPPLPDVQVHVLGTPRPALPRSPYRAVYDAARRN